MSVPVIETSGLSKMYRLGETTARRSALRLRLAAAVARIRSGLGAEVAVSAPPPDPTFWALRDISVDIAEGEVVGVIGRNGAGKSTLLKILSRITEPTAGRFVMRGRVASLLEVGTGFHGDLTGRENTFLNGAILGMTRREIYRKFDEIVAFAGIEKFIDTPVKRYSSGMYIRLAFAVAAHLEMDVLIVDEVLSVGDATFQAKCLDKINEVSQSGRTVLFVSHNLGSVQALCTRALWLDGGRVAASGSVGAVVSKYIESSNRSTIETRHRHRASEEPLAIHVVVRDANGVPSLTLKPWEPFDIDIVFNCRERIDRPSFWIGIDSRFGSLFAASMLLDGKRPSWVEGHGTLTCHFPRLPLLPQTYTVWVGVKDASGKRDLFAGEPVTMFSVVGSARDYRFEGEGADALLDRTCPLLLPYEWRYPDGTVASPDWTDVPTMTLPAEVR